MKLLPIAVLAGGLATRMLPKTEIIAKSMLPVAGKPFIHHQLTLLKDKGFEDVVVCTGHLGKQIEKFVGNGSQYGLNVSYSYDGEYLIGTAGAIKKALPLLGTSFFVTYGDSYLPDVDYYDVQRSFEEQKRLLLMTIYHNKDEYDDSNIWYDKDTKTIISYSKAYFPKKEYIDYGLSVFSSRAFNELQENVFCTLEEVYVGLLNRDEIDAYECNERFYEIGSEKGYEELDYLLSKKG